MAEHLDSITPLLVPDLHSKLNAYPISNQIKSPRVNDLSLLEPIGPAVLKQTSVRFTTTFDTQGFGRKKKL
jgi:hypothetical protein